MTNQEPPVQVLHWDHRDRARTPEGTIFQLVDLAGYWWVEVFIGDIIDHREVLATQRQAKLYAAYFAGSQGQLAGDTLRKLAFSAAQEACRMDPWT